MSKNLCFRALSTSHSLSKMSLDPFFMVAIIYMYVILSEVCLSHLNLLNFLNVFLKIPKISLVDIDVLELLMIYCLRNALSCFFLLKKCNIYSH